MGKLSVRRPLSKRRSICYKGVTRRQFVRGGLAAGAVVGAGIIAAPFVRNAEAATLKLRWLGWEHYNVKSLAAEFEKTYNVALSAAFFDGNSEAYNKLKAGGTDDFDMVMADGFWPRLYNSQGLTQPVNYSKLPNIKHVFQIGRAHV